MDIRTISHFLHSSSYTLNSHGKSSLKASQSISRLERLSRRGNITIFVICTERVGLRTAEWLPVSVNCLVFRFLFLVVSFYLILLFWGLRVSIIKYGSFFRKMKTGAKGENDYGFGKKNRDLEEVLSFKVTWEIMKNLHMVWTGYCLVVMILNIWKIIMMN